MSRGSLLVKSTALMALAKFIPQVLTILLIPLYTNYLSREELGLYDLVLLYIMLAVPVVQLSVEMAVFRFLIEARASSDKDRYASVVTNSSIVYAKAALVFAALFYVASFLVDVDYWGYIGVGIILMSAVAFLQQVARGVGRGYVFAISGSVVGLTLVASSLVVVAIMGLGIEGMFIALVLSNVAGVVYLAAALRLWRYIRTRLIDRSKQVELVKYSLPMIPNSVSWWAISAIDRSIIAIVLGISSNGIYAAAYKIPQVFSVLFSYFNLSWTEVAAIHARAADRADFFSRVMNVSVVGFISLASVMLAVVPFIFDLLIGPVFHEAYVYIPALLMGVVWSSIAAQYGAIYIALKDTPSILRSTVVGAIVSVAVTVAAIGWLGLHGVAIALPVSYSVVAIQRHYHIKRSIHIKYGSLKLWVAASIYMIGTGLYLLNMTAVSIVWLLTVSTVAVCLNMGIVRKLYSEAVKPVLSRVVSRR